MIVVSGSMKIDTSKGVNFKVAAKQVAMETRKEPGCIKYIVSADMEDASIFYMFEEWENRDALNAHFQTPHMADFQKKIGAAIVREGAKFQIYTIESVEPMGN